VKEVKKTENDWYQRNFWWILAIVLLFLAASFIIAGILVHPGLLVGLVAVVFGFYVVFEVRKLTQKGK
jgi:lipopolysaccharide export LptBFGC system permease protein LptF